MTDQEIQDFITIMAEVCIHYDPDEVRQRYGHLTLKEAVFQRMEEGRQAVQYLGDLVKKDLEAAERK